MIISAYTSTAIKTLGSLINVARRQQGMPQAELAERLGVTRQTVRAIEKGSHKVAIGTVYEAAHILSIPLMTLDKGNLPQWQAALANFDSLLPERVTTKHNEIDDDF